MNIKAQEITDVLNFVLLCGLKNKQKTLNAYIIYNIFVFS